MALHKATAGVDFGPLSDLNVFRLRLCNLDLCLQSARIGDPCEVDTRADLLPFRNFHFLENTWEPGSHAQVVALPLLELQRGVRLIDSRLLNRELRLALVRTAGELFLRDLVSHAKLLGVELRLAQLELRYELILRQ